MRKIESVEEIRKILVNLLLELKDVCEKNNLRYYLCGGTLLGAVRHKGFIPWDDDVDVYMPRPDYDKLIEIYSKNNQKSKLFCRELDKNYLYSFAKLVNPNTILIESKIKRFVELGVYIDIFPLDGLGNSKEDARAIMKKIEMPINLYASYRVNTIRKNVTLLKNIQVIGATIVSRLFYGKKRLGDKIDKIAKTYNYDESEYVGSFIDEVGERRIYKKEEVYKETCMLTFEGYEFTAPKEYHKILTQFYGDYMQLPPVEKRVFTHGYTAYVINDD